MSVERNYTFRISATDESATPQSEKHQSADLATEKRVEGLNTFNASNQESNRGVEAFHNSASGAAQLPRTTLIPEADGIPPVTERAREIASHSMSSGSLKKQAAFSNEPTTAGDSAGDIDILPTGEPPKMSVVPDARMSSEFVDQIRKLQSSSQAQATARGDAAEALSVIRQIKDMFLEQQRESVTREELKRELQTLRLVMEGRK